MLDRHKVGRTGGQAFASPLRSSRHVGVCSDGRQSDLHRGRAAPILQARCQTRHRPVKWADVVADIRGRASWARRSVQSGSRMMPRHLDPTVGIQKFANDT